ncbi:MAG: hypothetical protein WBX25_29575 [Rhodomicrobium sp.]
MLGRMDIGAASPEFIEQALQSSQSTLRSPRMFEAYGTSGVEGSVRWKPVKSIWISMMTLAALTGGPIFFTWGGLPRLGAAQSAVSSLFGAPLIHAARWLWAASL